MSESGHCSRKSNPNPGHPGTRLCNSAPVGIMASPSNPRPRLFPETHQRHPIVHGQESPVADWGYMIQLYQLSYIMCSTLTLTDARLEQKRAIRVNCNG